MDSWNLGFSLIALTMFIHVIGVTLLVSVLHRFRRRLESRSVRLQNVIAVIFAAFTGMGLVLTVLHGIEAAIWAGVYLWSGALTSPEAAIFYSIDSMTTRGASGVTLPPHWQMMGALEGVDGMLLFGISTAAIFTVMQLYYQHLILDQPGASVEPDLRRPTGSSDAE